MNLERGGLPRTKPKGKGKKLAQLDKEIWERYQQAKSHGSLTDWWVHYKIFSCKTNFAVYRGNNGATDADRYLEEFGSNPNRQAMQKMLGI